MARALSHVLCLSLFILLSPHGVEAKPKAKPVKTKAAATRDAATSSSTTEAAAAPKAKPAPQQSTKQRMLSPSGEPLNPAPSLFGFPGLWKAIGADALPARSFGGTGWIDRINRNPGFLTITDYGASGFVSLHRRFALSTQVNVTRKILMRRADQMSFGLQTLALLGKGGCPEPNCSPIQPGEIQLFPGQFIPLLFNDVHDPRFLSSEAGFYNMYPWVNRRSQSGVGEVVVAGHINLVDSEEGHGMAFALRPWVGIPTRYRVENLLRSGSQTGSFQYGLDFIAEGHLRDIMGTYFNLGFTYVTNPERGDRTLIGLKNTVPIRLGINIPRTSRLQWLTEYTADHFVGGGTRNRSQDYAADLTTGFRGFLKPWLSVSGGYRHTLNQFGGDKHGFVAQLAAAYVPLAEIPTPMPPTVTCKAEPSRVLAGQPITLTSTGSSTVAGAVLTYTWATTAGRIEGSGPTVKLNTAGLAPGTYTSTVRVDDGKGGFADCTVQWTIEAPPSPRAPTASCSADRTSVTAGEAVNVRVTASSPDKRPLNYDWQATGGRIEGSGASVRWDSSGLSAGTYTITARVTDDRGLSAECSVTVNVQVPPTPAKPAKLNECNFKANSPRVDNVCKAVLDDVALRLQSESGSRAVAIGHAAAREAKRSPKLAAQRASNVKAYLTTEKGIDGGRVEVRTGTMDASKVEIWLVPAGASAGDVPGTPTTEEPTVKKRVVRKKAAAAAEKAPAGEQAPAKKAPAKKEPAGKTPGAGIPR